MNLSRKAIVFAFAANMALAGFLLFQVQPMLAKYILPWFGGSATTWIVCMLFFQSALLAGYGLAYIVTLPFPVRMQAKVQIGLLLIGLALLPITPSEAWKPGALDDPTWRIVALLAASVGIPYMILAMTSPLLSRWLARIDPGLDPARFFAASNLGSFIGLLSYPFVFERTLTSGAQTLLWSWAFAAYAALFALCGLMTMAHAKGDERIHAGALWRATRGADPVLHWIAYAALGSLLLLAVTNAITQYLGVAPFLWVAPLSLYLLSFVMVFGQSKLYRRAYFAIAFLLLSGASLLLTRQTSSLDLALQLGMNLATLFAGCMVCHGELARLRPEPARLPKFYLAMAFGGALGGLLIALAAPLAFADYFEHPLVLLAIGGLCVWFLLRQAHWLRPLGAIASAFFLFGVGAAVYDEARIEQVLVERVRNFYGVLRVVRSEPGDPAFSSLVMQQAGVDQGLQFQRADRKLQPICGFDADSALGLAINHQVRRRADPNAPLRIGVIGLGAGMVASLGRPGDIITYYELNPAVLDLAKRRFTFLQESSARIDVLPGDARLVMERQLALGEKQNFDVLVMNAFRGASPPLHLMTREAFEVYITHLARDGVLAINFELDTFEMAPLHRGMAKAFRLGLGWFETQTSQECEQPISWALYTRDKSFFEAPQVKHAISQWRDKSRAELVWTDKSSNLMSILNWGRQP
jgi:hypothetical protein